MTGFEQDGDEIVLRMSRPQYEDFLMYYGYAMGAMCMAGERQLFAEALKLINELNHGNPNYESYIIPQS